MSATLPPTRCHFCGALAMVRVDVAERGGAPLLRDFCSARCAYLHGLSVGRLGLTP